MSEHLEHPEERVPRFQRIVGHGRAALLEKIDSRLPDIEADEAAEAVLCVLSRRLSGGTGRDLYMGLTENTRALFEGCQHESRTEHAPGFDKGSFYDAVATHLGIELDDVRRVLHAVFYGLQEEVEQELADQIASELPADLSSTWRDARRRAIEPW